MRKKKLDYKKLFETKTRELHTSICLGYDFEYELMEHKDSIRYLMVILVAVGLLALVLV